MASLVVKHAWARYLADTKDLDGLTYEEVEPTAWHRLQRSLDNPKVAPRKKKVTANAA